MFNRMRIYTVHIKPGLAHAAEKPVFVREGFNPFAFIFGVFWMLYKKLWLPALGIFCFMLLLMVTGKAHVLEPHVLGVLDLGFHALIGFHANDWLRAKLARSGYVLADISAGDSLLRAEQRYFERYLAGA